MILAVTQPDSNLAAQWMAHQIDEHGELYQIDAAEHIYQNFSDLTYENDNGNLAISKSVLSIFRTLTEGTVVWDRYARMWRRRNEDDPEGRSVY
jgi:hypothetical protein